MSTEKVDGAHLLPAPPAEGSNDAIRLDVRAASDYAVKLDSLGPMVVNKDGTLSRIANWEHMSDAERERTLRVLNARNQLRLADQRKKAEADESSTNDSAQEGA